MFESFRSAEICCSGVGCFNNNPPFGGIPLPQCPDTLQISMRVYTRGNPTAGQVVTRTTIPYGRVYIINKQLIEVTELSGI